MLKELHKSKKVTEIQVEPKEGERKLLCSNESDPRSPFLGFLDTSADSVTDDMILEYLACIVADIYLDQTNGNNTNKEGSTILPGINKGAS